MRHCLFKGKSTQLLKDLSETPIFRQAIGEGIAPTRMKDREIILRFFAFYLQDYRKHYQGDLSDFVERAMSLINRMEDAEIDKLRQVFLRVMKQTLDLFGSKNFRVSSSGSRGFINTSVFESVCLFFAHRQADSFKGHEAQIRQNYQQLLAHPNYLESVRFSTASKAKVNQRFELVEQILGTGIA